MWEKYCKFSASCLMLDAHWSPIYSWSKALQESKPSNWKILNVTQSCFSQNKYILTHCIIHRFTLISTLNWEWLVCFGKRKSQGNAWKFWPTPNVQALQSYSKCTNLENRTWNNISIIFIAMFIFLLWIKQHDNIFQN